MEIPQELLKESAKKPPKTDGVQAVGLKSAIKKKEFRVRYNPIRLANSGCFATKSL